MMSHNRDERGRGARTGPPMTDGPHSRPGWWRVPLFLNTHVNKVDRKGRVSVPASFRAALAGQSSGGIVAFPSFRAPAIEVVDRERMEQLSSSADDLAQFSGQRDDIATAIFSQAAELPFDGEGRIILPQAMAEHAGIGELAAFVGLGRSFQIWEPQAFERHRREAQDRVREQGAALVLRRPPEGGGR